MVQGLKYSLADNHSGTKPYIPGYLIYYMTTQNRVFSINGAVAIACPYGKNKTDWYCAILNKFLVDYTCKFKI